MINFEASLYNVNKKVETDVYIPKSILQPQRSK